MIDEKTAIEYDDLIDNYLFGRMTKGEEDSFIAECHANAELRDRAYTTALMVKALKSAGSSLKESSHDTEKI